MPRSPMGVRKGGREEYAGVEGRKYEVRRDRRKVREEGSAVRARDIAAIACFIKCEEGGGRRGED